MTTTDPFESFMRNYQDMVFTTAMRLLGNATDAQDIAQEVFLKAYERFPEFGGIQHLGGWLRRITTNLCLNHLTRYRARWRFFSELSDPEADASFVDSLPASEPQAGEVSEADRRALLEVALQKLPRDQRVPLVLYHFEEMSYDEIAQQTGASLSKVKVDIHRGREALRKRLQTRVGQELGAPDPGASWSAFSRQMAPG